MRASTFVFANLIGSGDAAAGRGPQMPANGFV